MSRPQDGRRMDRLTAAERLRGLPGMARGNSIKGDGSKEPQRPQISRPAISRPTQVPQWPLAGPLPPPAINQRHYNQQPPPPPYEPPAGREQPPQRPPRPSLVPSILDGSRIQDPVPSFQYFPTDHYDGGDGQYQVERTDSERALPDQQLYNQSAGAWSGNTLTVPDRGLDSPASDGMTASSRYTGSSFGSFSDFPAPGGGGVVVGGSAGGGAGDRGSIQTITAVPPRRSILGPPPSSRRGASSFYSTASMVSPIPEESSRSRSRESYASSAAIPDRESWSNESQHFSPTGLTPIQSPEAPSSGGDGGMQSFLNSPNREDMDEDDSDDGDDDDDDDDNDDNDEMYAVYDEYTADNEQGLVRSASIGKRARPALVMNRSPSIGSNGGRPAPRPLQRAESDSETSSDGPAVGYAAGSNSSQALPTRIRDAGDQQAEAMSRSMLGAFAAAGFMESVSPSRQVGAPTIIQSLSENILPPPPTERNPRESTTSLPGMIKRATRILAIIDRSSASYADNFEILSAGKDSPAPGEGASSDPRQSGLTEILAAFPPPSQQVPSRPNNRGSWFSGPNSWSSPPQQHDAYQNAPPYTPHDYSRGHYSPRNAHPLREPMERPQSVYETPYSTDEKSSDNEKSAKKRFCGLPRWALILIALFVLAAVAVSIIIPLLFFVFHVLPLGSDAASECRSQTTCLNGGMAIMSQGTCSCICTGGFTGPTCEDAGSVGCTTTDLLGPDGEAQVSNATMGTAIPRLVSTSQSLFAVPLSGSSILAKFNADGLSCVAQNSLVTFNGQAWNPDANNTDVPVLMADAAEVQTLVIPPGESMVLTLANFQVNHEGATPRVTTVYGRTVTITITVTLAPSPLPPATLTRASTTKSTHRTTTTSSTSRPTSTATSTLESDPTITPAPSPTPEFSVSDEAIEFARVAVLFVLQEQSVADAGNAQTALQRFFSQDGDGKDDPRNIDLGNGNFIDLVEFGIQIGGDGAAAGRKNVVLEEWNDGADGWDEEGDVEWEGSRIKRGRRVRVVGV